MVQSYEYNFNTTRIKFRSKCGCYYHISLLEAFQPLSARPSDKGRMNLQTLNLWEIVFEMKGPQILIFCMNLEILFSGFKVGDFYKFKLIGLHGTYVVPTWDLKESLKIDQSQETLRRASR